MVVASSSSLSKALNAQEHQEGECHAYLPVFAAFEPGIWQSSLFVLGLYLHALGFLLLTWNSSKTCYATHPFQTQLPIIVESVESHTDAQFLSQQGVRASQVTHSAQATLRLLSVHQVQVGTLRLPL